MRWIQPSTEVNVFPQYIFHAALIGLIKLKSSYRIPPETQQSINNHLNHQTCYTHEEKSLNRKKSQHEEKASQAIHLTIGQLVRTPYRTKFHQNFKRIRRISSIWSTINDVHWIMKLLISNNLWRSIACIWWLAKNCWSAWKVREILTISGQPSIRAPQCMIFSEEKICRRAFGKVEVQLGLKNTR